MRNILKKLLLVLFILLQNIIFAENRVAVVISNSRYPKNLLTQVESNVDIILEVLNSKGYQVKYLNNLGKDQLENELDAISNTLNFDSNLLVYYSGFMLDVNGTSYLIPSDARPKVESDVDPSSIELKYLITSLLKNKPNKSIFYLDPIGRSPRGYQNEYNGINEINCEEIEKEAYYVVGYNTSPYSVVDSKNSNIFSQSIVDKFSNYSDDFLKLMKEVRFNVSHVTFGNQKPWYDVNTFISSSRVVEVDKIETKVKEDKQKKSTPKVAVRTDSNKSDKDIASNNINSQKVTRGKIKVLSDRSGTIYIDGKYTGMVDANNLKEFSNIKKGNRKVKIFYRDNQSSEKIIDIKNDTASYINFSSPKKDYGFWLDMGFMIMEKTDISQYDNSISGVGPTISLSWNFDDYFQWGLGTGFLVYEDEDGSNTIPTGFVSFAVGDKLNSFALRGQLGTPMAIGFNIKSFYLNFSFIPDYDFYGIQIGLDLNIK